MEFWYNVCLYKKQTPKSYNNYKLSFPGNENLSKNGKELKGPVYYKNSKML